MASLAVASLVPLTSSANCVCLILQERLVSAGIDDSDSDDEEEGGSSSEDETAGKDVD